MSKIAFIASDNRKYNIERCLSLIKSEVLSGLKNAETIVVKPDCITDKFGVGATNWETLDAVIGFLAPHVKSQIILAGNATTGNTLTAFENFGYMKLRDKYDIAIVDLNTDDIGCIDLLDSSGNAWQAHLPKTLTEADFLVSVSSPKTHNLTAYAGAVKNVSAHNTSKQKGKITSLLSSRFTRRHNKQEPINQGPKIINENIKRIYQKIPLGLAVLDGFEAMEGDGPDDSRIVSAHFAVASSDPLAADWLTHTLMGIRGTDIGYLALLNTAGTEHFVIGDDWRSKVVHLKMHQKL